MRHAPGAPLFGRPLALRCRTHRPYRTDRSAGYLPLAVTDIRYAMPALGTAVGYVTALDAAVGYVTALGGSTLRVPALDVFALGVGALGAAALLMTGLSVVYLGMAGLRTAVLSVPPRCAAFPYQALLHPAFLRTAFRRSPYLHTVFRVLSRVLADVRTVMLAPTVRRSLMIFRVIFGGLLRRSEPSPIATTAARRAVIGCRGGRSVHGLPRLERLSIVFALPQSGMCPQFPRTASEYLIDQSCPGNTLHSGHTSRSSGTACGLLLRSVPPAPAHRTNTWKSGRGGPLCH